jgi:hypothetical protein
MFSLLSVGYIWNREKFLGTDRNSQSQSLPHAAWQDKGKLGLSTEIADFLRRSWECHLISQGHSFVIWQIEIIQEYCQMSMAHGFKKIYILGLLKNYFEQRVNLAKLLYLPKLN